MNIAHLGKVKRQVKGEDDSTVSSYSSNTAVKWIMCDNNDIAAIESTKHAYNCQTRPYMTALLIVSILIFIVLRKSSYIKKWVTSHHQQEEQADEEEGLMQRVF